MRIQKIHLKNVGPFENQEIEFKEVANTDRKAEVHIFTGANGTGKTTLLHGLAATFNNQDNNIRSRFHLKNKGRLIVGLHGGGDFVMENRFNNHLSHDIKNKKVRELVYKYKGEIRDPNYFPNYQTFACFAYSGYRNFSNQHLTGIVEINQNPLVDSLLFYKKDGNQLLSQWLTNMFAKEALSQSHGNGHEQNYRKILSKFEDAINQLTEDTFSFRLNINPLQIVLVKNGVELNFDLLPDGLKSFISWLGDLLMRLDRTPWVGNTSILERNIILFLDEIEVHLHPKWQMKVLPIVQELFPNAQIFISTHSPFVVNSVDDAWVYKLDFDEKGNSICKDIFKSETGKSYSYVLDEIFGVKEEFGQETERLLDRFYKMRDDLLAGKNIDENSFREITKELLTEGIEVEQIIGSELRQIQRITKKKFQLW